MSSTSCGIAFFDYFFVAHEVDGVEGNEDRNDVDKAVNNQARSDNIT